MHDNLMRHVESSLGTVRTDTTAGFSALEATVAPLTAAAELAPAFNHQIMSDVNRVAAVAAQLEVTLNTAQETIQQ